MAEHLYLGIDGGQSSTVALIGDEYGVVLGFGQAGPCNHVKTSRGPAKLRRAVLGAVKTAWHNSPLSSRRLPTFDSAYFGMSGGPEDKAAIIQEVLHAKRLEVTHDAVTALMGATEGRPGIIVISGTGSICFGMNEEGATARAGGWGYVFGDEGSAFDTARQALRASLAMEEGWGPSTALRDRIVTFSGTADVNEALHKWYTEEYPRSKAATFARVVDECAIAGDRVARGILRNAAGSLAHLVAQVRRRLFRPKDEVLVSYIGGAFRSRILLDRFKQQVRGQASAPGRNRVLPPALGPAAGALLAAYRAAGHRDVRLRNLPPEA
jgi:N-acetylglucosamine kinase-like BadF-type ATPase